MVRKIPSDSIPKSEIVKTHTKVSWLMAQPHPLLPEATMLYFHGPHPSTTGGALLNASVAYHGIVTKHSGGTAGESHPVSIEICAYNNDYFTLLQRMSKRSPTVGTILAGTGVAVTVTVRGGKHDPRERLSRPHQITRSKLYPDSPACITHE